MEIVTKVKEKEWKKFLDICATASVYHTPEWKGFLEETFNYKPYYFFAKDEYGEIVGLLPLFHVKSKLTGNRLCSVPFSHDCGPIGSSAAMNLLTNEIINLYGNLSLNYIEIRNLVGIDCFQQQNAFCTYILELSNIESTRNLIHKSVRRYIKKSLDKVQISKSNNIEDVEFFYQINCKNKKDKGVPAHPKNFFFSLVRMLSDNITIYLAKFKNENIGGIITLSSGKGKILYGYGASDPQYPNHYPLYACLWKSIEDACLNKYKSYDFGRVSYDNTGLINFKKKWGGIEKRLYYSYYPKCSESLIENRDNIKYRVGTKIIRNMPMPIYKTFSNAAFGHFG